jgi:hypothetical protein
MRNFFLSIPATVAAFLFCRSAVATVNVVDLEGNLKKIYMVSHFSKAIQNEMLASEILQKNVFRKFKFNLFSELTRDRGDELSESSLNRVGRYDEALSSLTVGGNYRFVNSPILSSLTFESRYKIEKSDYTLADQTYATPSDNASQFDFTVSYDLLRGGGRESQYLSSAVEQGQLKSNVFQSLKGQTDGYLSFLEAAYRAMVTYCSLKNFDKSLEEIEKTEKVFQIGSQVGTYAYKDYLNVKSLKGVVRGAKLNLVVELQNQIQNFFLFGSEAKKKLEELLTSDSVCENYLGLGASTTNLIPSSRSSSEKFQKTIAAKVVTSQIESTTSRVKLAQMNLLPSLTPFFTLSRSREQTLDVEDRRVAVGIRVDWDVASQYGSASATSELYNLTRLGTRYRLSEYEFENKIKNLRQRNENIHNQIENVTALIQINDELLNILKTQRSIGKIDSLSLTNAYLNRNQSLSQLYELNAQMMLNNFKYKYTFEWSEFSLDRIGEQ